MVRRGNASSLDKLLNEIEVKDFMKRTGINNKDSYKKVSCKLINYVICLEARLKAYDLAMRCFKK